MLWIKRIICNFLYLKHFLKMFKKSKRDFIRVQF